MRPKKLNILGLDISTKSLEETVDWIKNKHGVVYCCTLNEVLAAKEDKQLAKVLNSGDVLTADGMPLVWMLRHKTGKGERVYGPDLMRMFQNKNENFKLKQLFIGNQFNKKYFEKFGRYIILPFKDSFEESDYEMMVKKIKESKVEVIWIGLGAKKQLIVAHELSRRLPDRVYVTVGAAFDFLSGNKKQAPRWLRNIGGEWLFRLVTEPKRLARRYLKVIGFLIKTAVDHIVQAGE